MKKKIVNAVDALETTDKVKRQLKAYLETCKVIGDLIKELGTVPSGVMYAQLMQHIDLATYQHVLDTLVRSGAVQRSSSHLLKWVDPK